MERRQHEEMERRQREQARRERDERLQREQEWQQRQAYEARKAREAEERDQYAAYQQAMDANDGHLYSGLPSTSAWPMQQTDTRSKSSRRSKAAKEWYNEDESHPRREAPGRRPQQQHPAASQHHNRTDTGLSSIAGELPYDRYEEAARAAVEPYKAKAESTAPVQVGPSPTLSLAHRPAVRETIYEDDFEEADEELAVNLSRYTQYEGATDADYDDNSGPWAGARKSLFRSTTDEPLPTARCADCGESFSFEDLADHACEQASLPGTPTAGTPTMSLTPVKTLVPLPEGEELPSGDEHMHTRARAGSPFLDRYEEIHGKKSPQRSPLMGHFGGPTRSASTDERSGSRERGRLGLGLNMGDEMQRSQTSPIGSPLSDMGKTQRERAQQPPSQASTTSSDLRKRIEAQREAKRKNSGVSPIVHSPVDGRFAHLDAAPSQLLSTQSSNTRTTPRKMSASSSSSAGTQASSLLAPGSSPVSLALTPSSTVDGLSDIASHPSSPPRKDLLSPKSAQVAWDGLNAAEKSACISEVHKMRGTSPTRSTRSGSKSPVVAALPTLKSSSISPRIGSRRSPRSRDIDLGGIEDLLKDLETTDGVKSGLSSRRQAPAPLKLAASADRAKTSSSSTSLDAPRRRVRTTRLCCVCMCSLSSSKGRFVEKDGKYFCAEDYKQLYLPKCTKCRQPVEKDAVKSRDGALKGVFHRSCFCCFHCDARFEDGIFYIFENAPYCFSHYSNLAGTQCASCSHGIEGICRQTENGERYHPHCLTCQFENVKTKEFCQDILDDFYIIGGRRLCEQHAHSVQTMLDKAGQKKARAEKRRTMLRHLV